MNQVSSSAASVVVDGLEEQSRITWQQMMRSAWMDISLSIVLYIVTLPLEEIATSVGTDAAGRGTLSSIRGFAKVKELKRRSKENVRSLVLQPI